MDGTLKFVEKVRQALPEATLLIRIESGDHGFDAGATLETLWLKEGLEFVTNAWLS